MVLLGTIVVKFYIVLFFLTSQKYVFFFKITSGGACGALAIAFRPENAAATLYQCFLATGLQFRSVYMLLDSLPVDFASLKSRKSQTTAPSQLSVLVATPKDVCKHKEMSRFGPIWSSFWEYLLHVSCNISATTRPILDFNGAFEPPNP